jgi:hypothetical protein
LQLGSPASGVSPARSRVGYRLSCLHGFITLDELARITGNSTAELLAAVELEALEDLVDWRV